MAARLSSILDGYSDDDTDVVIASQESPKVERKKQVVLESSSSDDSDVISDSDEGSGPAQAEGGASLLPEGEQHDEEDSWQDESVSVDARFLKGDGFVTVEESEVPDEISYLASELNYDSEDWADRELKQLKEKVQNRAIEDQEVVSPGRSADFYPVEVDADSPGWRERFMSARTPKSKRRSDLGAGGEEQRSLLRSMTLNKRTSAQPNSVRTVSSLVSPRSNSLGGGERDRPDTKSLLRSSSRTPSRTFSPTLLERGTPEELFDLFMDLESHKVDSDYMRDYVMTLSYYAIPLEVLQSLLAQYREAARGKNRADRDKVLHLGHVLFFWVSTMYSEFESGGPLNAPFREFLEKDLGDSKSALGITLRDLISRRKQLYEERRAEGALYDKPWDKKRVRLQFDDSSEESEEEEGPDDDDAVAEEDVRSTFVGVEQYHEKTRPMGLFGLDADGSEEDSISSASSDLDAPVVGTMSKPMGLWELMDEPWEYRKPSNTVVSPPQTPKANRHTTKPGGPVRPAEMAKQLTLLMGHQFSLITVSELLKSEWLSSQPEAAPHVKSLLQWHKNIMGWVQNSILEAGLEQDKRMVVLRRFLRIIAAMRKFNNYEGIFCIAEGILDEKISRLGDHELLVDGDKETYEWIQTLGDQSDNWKGYRAMKDKMSKNIVFFPAIQVYLEDLLTVEKATDLWVSKSEGIINFAKMRQLGAIVRDLVEFQSTFDYKFAPQPYILDYLRGVAAQIAKEEVLWIMSRRIKRPIEFE